MAVSSSSWNERDSTAGEVYFPSVAQNPALNGRAGSRVDVLEERRKFFLEWEDEYDRKISEMDVSGALDLLVKFPGRPLSSTENESADAALGLDLANQGEEIWEGGRGPVLFQGEKEITRAKVVEILPPSASESSSSPILSPSLQFQLLRVLDAGLGSSEITAVGAAYDWLTANGVLRHFGTFPLPSGSRVVTPASLQFSAGIDAQRLSPKKWGMAGGGWGPLNVLGVFSALVNNGVEIRPLAVLLLGLAMADAVWLGGTGWGQLLSVWKPYRRRILVHEAGHILAGTQFWDAALEEEIQKGLLTSSTIDRYCMVLFAGIAAEALVYGEAQGGESDENLFKSFISALQPSWSPAKMSNQARWSVLQSFLLLRRHLAAHSALVECLEEGRTSMSQLVMAIERTLDGKDAE